MDITTTKNVIQSSSDRWTIHWKTNVSCQKQASRKHVESFAWNKDVSNDLTSHIYFLCHSVQCFNICSLNDFYQIVFNNKETFMNNKTVKYEGIGVCIRSSYSDSLIQIEKIICLSDFRRVFCLFSVVFFYCCCFVYCCGCCGFLVFCLTHKTIKFSPHGSTILVKDLIFFYWKRQYKYQRTYYFPSKKNGNKLPLHATLLTLKKIVEFIANFILWS